MFKALMFVALVAFVAFGVTLYVATNQMAGRASLVVPETVTTDVAESPAAKGAKGGKRRGAKSRGGVVGTKNVNTNSPTPAVRPKASLPIEPLRLMN